MSASNHCSEILHCRISLKIKCVHCEATNYVSQDAKARYEIDEITCWRCTKDSLTSEVLLADYPDYPNESVGGHYRGKSSPDYT